MADVRFDESGLGGGAPQPMYQPRPGMTMPGQYGQGNRFTSGQSTSFMVRTVMKSGLAHDEKSANKVLLIIAAVSFLLSLFFFIRLAFT